MAAPLTSIANRMTPSVPIQITFGQQVIATGRKFATLFGHMASSGGTGTPYQVYTVLNVGDPVAGQAEVDAIAGTGSQIGAMAGAFIKANAFGGQGNFPAFRVVLIPNAEASFGPSDEALTAAIGLRSDLVVSCYPASDAANQTKIKNFTIQISGIDRDLNGQFGSFYVLGSLDAVAAEVAFNFNDKYGLVAGLPDSNTALVPILGTVTSASDIISAITQAALTPTGDVTSGSNIIANMSSVADIYPGASITGAGIAGGATVEKVIGTSIQISVNASATSSGEALSIVNLPTAGVYPGARLSGTGIPANTTAIAVNANTIQMSAVATSTAASEAIGAQNVVSQAAELVASANAAVMLASAFPYFPLQGVSVGGLVAPRKSSDWVLFDPSGPSETLLNAGIAPLSVQSNGTVVLMRTRTTWTMNGLTPTTAYFDWQDLVTLNDFREVCFAIAENPPFNGNPGGTKASQSIANLFKDEVLRQAQAFEDQQAFQGVKSLADQFVVAPSTSQRGRFDFKIPVNVLPGLYVIAGNIQAVTTFDFTL